jgi:hypothetical protein
VDAAGAAAGGVRLRCRVHALVFEGVSFYIKAGPCIAGCENEPVAPENDR